MKSPYVTACKALDRKVIVSAFAGEDGHVSISCSISVQSARGLIADIERTIGVIERDTAAQAEFDAALHAALAADEAA